MYSLRWYKQDSPVEETERIQRIGSCLSITHVEESDSGPWHCVANNSEGQDKLQLYIQVKSSLSIEMSPSGQVVVDVGHKIELHCRVSPKRLASAKAWLKDGLVLRRNSEEVLVLDRVQREDAGMYQCHVSADDDSAQMSAQRNNDSRVKSTEYRAIAVSRVSGYNGHTTEFPDPNRVSSNLDFFKGTEGY
ncbi:hypothetical protein WDU94_001698 [Cyamophila willieti]